MDFSFLDMIASNSILAGIILVGLVALSITFWKTSSKKTKPFSFSRLALFKKTWIPKAIRMSVLMLLIVFSVGTTLLVAEFKYKDEQIKRETVEEWNIVILSDESLSMEGYTSGAFDIDPKYWTTQLEATHKNIKLLLEHIMQKFPGSRVSGVLFGDIAYQVWPLSQDVEQVYELMPLDKESPLENHMRGTYIGRALIQALSHLEEMNINESVIMIMMTDGNDDISDEEYELISYLWNRLDNRHFILAGLSIGRYSSIMDICRKFNGICVSDVDPMISLNETLAAFKKFTPSPTIIETVVEGKTNVALERFLTLIVAGSFGLILLLCIYYRLV